MASLVDENCHELLRNNFSDHNISNNGQHVFNHCHGRREHVQHDTLFIDQEFPSYNVHEKQVHQNIKEYHNRDDKEENVISKIKNSVNDLEKENNKSTDTHDETKEDEADIEIIFFVENELDTMRIGIVSKSYLPTENQTILAASFKIKDDSKDVTNTKKHDSDKDKKVQHEGDENKDMFTTPKKSSNVSKSKHVHFQEQSVNSKHVNLKSHKMEKETVKDNKMQEVKIINNCNDNYGQICDKKSFNNTTVTNTPNNATKAENQSKPRFRHTQNSSSHVSTSDSDLRYHKHRKTNTFENQLKDDKKTIYILRRDNEVMIKADAIDYGEAKENQKQNISYQMKANTSNQTKYNANDTKKQKKVIQGSASHTFTTSSTDNDERISRRSKSTIDANDAKLVEEKKEKERLRKKLSRKKQRRSKQKPPKTDLEIYQKQIETGQLRSMFSRYKTEGLKCLELQGLLHKGTFCNKYKAYFKNKQVVLSVYDSETAELINALDMAIMPSSYFVLGFNDCMTGPYGKLWFMSMFHNFGDLNKLLSRDQSRHVIGEVHAQFITAGVLIGVDFLHQHSIVHGNIKPSKVLINALGYPVLTGFVKMADKADIEGSEAYTPAYAAPERVRGNRQPPIDVYSVGCMAYEIITGVVPSNGSKRAQTDGENMNKTCRPIYDPDLFSFAGEFFIDSCLRKNAKERFLIGVERSNLIYEEWFSTLDWRDLRRQTLRSPILNALQLIDNRAKLSLEEKTVQFKWGQVMDVLCPYTPSLHVDEDSFD